MPNHLQSTLYKIQNCPTKFTALVPILLGLPVGMDQDNYVIT